MYVVAMMVVRWCASCSIEVLIYRSKTVGGYMTLLPLQNPKRIPKYLRCFMHGWRRRVSKGKGTHFQLWQVARGFTKLSREPDPSLKTTIFIMVGNRLKSGLDGPRGGKARADRAATLTKRVRASLDLKQIHDTVFKSHFRRSVFSLVPQSTRYFLLLHE